MAAATILQFETQQLGGSGINNDVNKAIIILQKEIERDRRLVQPRMTGSHLRKTREELKTGLKKKEPLAKSLQKYRRPAIDQAIKLFARVTEDEREIVKNMSVSHRNKRNAYNTLKNNIPRKEKALRIFKNWRR